MNTYTVIFAEDLSYFHLNVYRLYLDGLCCGYRILADDGYVFYNIHANDVEIDPITQQEKRVYYYKTRAELPITYDFNNSPYLAVAKSEVDPNYIF